MQEDQKDVSVALSYKLGEQAPVVLASGKGEIAKRINDIAAEHGIRIVKDSSLANILIQSEIGACIPEETYRAVAVIFAFLEKQGKNEPPLQGTSSKIL